MPTCQSTLREFYIKAEPGSYLSLGGSLSLIHKRPGLQSTAQADDQGKITLTITGPAPRNEDGAVEICARLVRTLNRTGGDWSIPTEGKQDIDRYSTDSAGNKLQMQVARAGNNNRLWQVVNDAGSATMDYSTSTAAREMIDAILKKSGKYPAEQKKHLSLVLDAARTPSHTFQQVGDAFRTQHLEECQKAGFAEVWIVGPQDSLVERLDR
jgi:hypothetical protein